MQEDLHKALTKIRACLSPVSQILEAGPHSLNVDTHVQPARYVANLFNPNKLSKSFTLHAAQPSEAVANRKIVVPAGRVLGGGSSVNCELRSGHTFSTI